MQKKLLNRENGCNLSIIFILSAFRSSVLPNRSFDPACIWLNIVSVTVNVLHFNLDGNNIITDGNSR